MCTSLRAGIAAVPEGAPAAVVMLADMPFVTAEMVRELIERWQGEPLAVSLYGDVVAPPILYARALFPELRVVERHRKDALEVPRPAAALADLDVPADVERVRSVLEGG